MNEFVRKSSTILSAKVRAMNSSAGIVNNAIIVLEDGADVIAPVSVIRNTLDRKIQPSELRCLIGSTLYYDSSDVKKGDDFSFVPNGDKSVAERDLHITTIKAIVLTDKADAIVEAMPAYVADTEPVYDTASEIDIEAIKAEIDAANNVPACRAIVEKYEVFDDMDVDGLTNAKDFKLALTTVVEGL